MKTTYIITGAGKGMGRFFAKTIATLGGNLALIARTVSDLDSLASELTQVNSEIKISTHPIDLSDSQQTKNAFDAIREIHGNTIEEDFIKPASVADEIHHVINQTKDAWTFEWDIRPYTRNTKLIV